MGFQYRKSISIGPLHIIVGKSGVRGFALGKAFRTGVSALGTRKNTFTVLRNRWRTTRRWNATNLKHVSKE